jgi:hypothetical protein
VRTNTLGFYVYTTKYLGRPSKIEYVVEQLLNIPRKYIPTKSEVNSSKSKDLFSINDLNPLLEKVAVENPFGGYVRLYKVKSIFDMYINWSRGPLDMLKEEPNRVFNNINIYIDDGLECLKNKKDFQILRSIWINLCEELEALYGQCFLHDSTSNSNSYLGWGFGKCIPRLHWQTYFGKPYMSHMNFEQNILHERCIIEELPSGAKVLSINANPIDLTLRSDIEREIVNSLGPEFFWNEHDNRLKPMCEYKMPELDLSELIYNPSDRFFT